MDLLAKLMNPNKPLERICVPTGQVNGVMNITATEDDQCEEFARCQSEENNTDYAEEYRRIEEALYSESSKVHDEQRGVAEAGTMSVVDSNMDLLSSLGRVEVSNMKEEQLLEAYTKYDFNRRRTQGLLIDDYRERILSFINTNDTVVIQGPTGCGKTTQVPQFILDDCKAKEKPCRIIVTQPRRIAAISVARRVCEERNWTLGTVCGYQVGLDSNLSRETLLGYVTTGVLLQKLIKQKNLHEYTHIVVDEVHERNQDMDFLLLIIRKFLNTNSANTKIILMSATFDANEFSVYFKNYSLGRFIPAPVISVAATGTKYNTQIYYADQLKEIGMIPIYEIDEPKIEHCLFELFVVLVRAFERLDPTNHITKAKIIGNVLVFLPGIYEIEEAHERLDKYKDKEKLLVIPLHSSITIEEQRRVFQPPPPGYRKIILSTNIAESSITVPDIVYVVDFCLTKTMIVDPATQYQSLQLQWASHVNCTQRAGRVGRVADGRVYRLVPRDFYETCMPETVQPEIMRAPLNQVVLKAKLLELNQPPRAILALAMNPPELAKIESTVLFLKEIGALLMKSDGVKSATDGDITFLGTVMASLPMDVHLSKFIFLGHMFSCLQECVIMAAGCSLSIFKSPFKERFKAYVNRLMWADGSASDLITHLNIYKMWQNKKRLNNTKVQLDWCRANCVSLKSLREWSILVREIQDRLVGLHIQRSEGPGSVVLSNTELPTVIKVVICGAFYPYYFKRSADAGQIDEREAVKTLGGRDPFSTVYFTGFDSQQPGPLYADFIKNLLKNCGSHMEVSFDSSSKVYVQFTSPQQIGRTQVVDGQVYNNGMPGKIRTDVYRAIRLRQLQMPMNILVLEREKAWKLMEQKGLRKLQQLPLHCSKAPEEEEEEDEKSSAIAHSPVLPGLDVQFIRISICERVDCGHFWAHNVDDVTEETLFVLQRVLNSEKLEKVEPEDVKIDGIYAAQYKVDKKFYRCKVISKILNSRYGEQAQITFIDYGNTDTLPLNHLFVLPQHDYMSRPPQAMECYLSGIQPSAVVNPRALWSAQADAVFNHQTSGNTFFGKVYSVVQGIVHLELYENKQKPPVFNNSLNNWLIQQGYAQPAEESFLSKENHTKRQQPEKLSAYMKEESAQKLDVQDVEPPDSKMCSATISLRGPHSPLEMKIYSVVASGANKQVFIDGNSVNAVLLDTNPEDPHERLIVAAHIGQSALGERLSLRHSTVMPNIHGFPMLMSLLFCPTMETKPTEDGTRFGAILCGLGAYDDGQRAIYPPHDICLTLDTDLTDEDLNKINALRYWMNMTVESMKCNSESQEIASTTDVGTCQRELKQRLFELLKGQRKSVERISLPNANVWGRCLYYSELLKPGESHLTAEIWPLHSTMQLNRNATIKTSLKEHLNELTEITLRMRTPPSNEIQCHFCNVTVYSAGEMRLHMTTQKHIEAVRSAEAGEANKSEY